MEVRHNIRRQHCPYEIGFNRIEALDPFDDSEPEVIQYQRPVDKAGSRQSRRDDLYMLRYRTHAVAAYHTAAISDMHRIPISTILDFFDFLIDGNHTTAFLYALLLLTTGCDDDDLQQLTISSHATADGISFDLSTSTLCLPFRNAEIKTPNALGNHVTQYMRLLLPTLMIRIFRDNRNIANPFHMTSFELNQAAKYFAMQYPDQTPTTARIRNAFETVFATAGFRNELEAAYISGNIPSKFATQACYYQLDVSRLNFAYQQAWMHFIDQALEFPISEPLQKILQACKSFDLNKIPNGNIGSQLCTNRSPYLQLLDELRLRFNQQNRLMPHLDLAVKIRKCTYLLSLQHLYFYLLIQITMALRPPGPATTLMLPESQWHAWSHTKDSKNYIERNLSVCLESVRNQWQTIRKDLKHFRSMAERQLSIVDIETVPSHLPSHFTFVTDMSRLEIRQLTGGRARQMLNQYIMDFGIDLDLPKRANNIFRHINASLMHGLCPQPLLDEYMGHGREGLYSLDPFSTTSLKSWPEIELHIAELGKSIPKTPLRINL